MSQNNLKIEAQSLDLELTGEADYVIRAYEAIRPVLLERFEDTLIEEEHRSPGTSRSKSKKPSESRGNTAPLHQVDGVTQHVAAGRELTRFHLQFVVCTELYYRVAALTRDEFRNSIFGEVLEPKAISKLYVAEDAAESMRDQIEFGKTLWRELTKAGKAAIHGDPP